MNACTLSLGTLVSVSHAEESTTLEFEHGALTVSRHEAIGLAFSLSDLVK